MTEQIIGFLYALPGVLFALSIHEFSHGYVAYKLGDPTAKNYGRLTLNPLKHLDVFGAIAMLLVGVGWAKPVPVNTRYFKKYKRDTALVAFAGPVSNLLSSLVGMFLYYGIIKFIFPIKPEFFLSSIWIGLSQIIISFIFVNVGLAVFNLIPVPPLDGSRIVDSFLPQKALTSCLKTSSPCPGKILSAKKRPSPSRASPFILSCIRCPIVSVSSKRPWWSGSSWCATPIGWTRAASSTRSRSL